MTTKIYNIVALQAWGARRRCELRDGAGSTASWALRHHGLREDDDVAGLGTMSVDNIVGSRTASGAQRHRLREGNIVAARKGARPWSAMMARRLWGGLDDGAEDPGRTR
jgi:isopentenyl diphosphate isomerase/L-lactate dehydrogenase-like FMN-dependent dehydrogenase